MKVAVLPWRKATFLTTCLNHMVWSAISSSSSNRMSISPWPAVATSWCWHSTWMPSSSRASTISLRMSTCRSIGLTGK